MGLLKWIFGDPVGDAGRMAAQQQEILDRNLTQQQQFFFKNLKVVMSDATTAIDSVLTNLDAIIEKQRKLFLSDIDGIATKQIDDLTNNSILVASRLPFGENDPIMQKYFSEIDSTNGFLIVKFRGYFPMDKNFTYNLTIGGDEDPRKRYVLSSFIHEPQLICFRMPLSGTAEVTDDMQIKKVVQLPIKLANTEVGWIVTQENLMAKTFLLIIHK